MDLGNIKLAKTLLNELEELEKYKKLLEDFEHGKTAHFEFVQHYGKCSDYNKVVIPAKYRDKFIPALEVLIEEIKNDLKEL